MGFGNTIKVVANALVAKFSPDQKRVPAGQHGGGEFADGNDGIVAFHGTPHIVPEFSSDKIGTGQQAQSYGHGLYFAENKDVAETYKDAGSGGVVIVNNDARVNGVLLDGVQIESIDDLRAAARKADTASSFVVRIESIARNQTPGQSFYEAAKEYLATKKGFDRDGKREFLAGAKLFDDRITRIPFGNLYQVKIDVKPNELLDWDKPLGEQDDNVKRALIKGGATSFVGTGGDYYNRLSRMSGQKEMSDHLNSLGIKGIRYLDQGSRSPASIPRLEENITNVKAKIAEWSLPQKAQWGDVARSQLDAYNKELKQLSDELDKSKASPPATHNFVIFDDKRVHITHVNGKELTPQESVQKSIEIRKAFRTLAKTRGVNTTQSSGKRTQPEPVLPKSLAGAKPRYGNGSRLFELEFSRPVELALYIIGSKHKSKHEKAYQKWLMSVIPDVTEKDLKVTAQRLRDYIRKEVKTAISDVITIPMDWEKELRGDDAEVVKSCAAEFEAIGQAIAAPVSKSRDRLAKLDGEQAVRFFMAVPAGQVAKCMASRQIDGKSAVLASTPAGARKMVAKFNSNHDDKGRFASGGTGAAASDKPGRDQTHTAEFKAWFGSSKVVNPDGSPMVVYHGTSARFKRFVGGAFFTDDYMNADGYANGENVIDAFIKIEKPLIVNCHGKKWDDLDSKLGKSSREIVASLDAKKYDGIIFNNIKDSWIDDADVQNAGTVYYVSSNTQIKSATSNRGTFNPKNADITKSVVLEVIVERSELGQALDTRIAKCGRWFSVLKTSDGDVVKVHEVGPGATLRLSAVTIRPFTGKLMQSVDISPDRLEEDLAKAREFVAETGAVEIAKGDKSDRETIAEFVAKYDDSQARDDHGRWTSTGGGDSTEQWKITAAKHQKAVAAASGKFAEFITMSKAWYPDTTEAEWKEKQSTADKLFSYMATPAVWRWVHNVEGALVHPSIDSLNTTINAMASTANVQPGLCAGAWVSERGESKGRLHLDGGTDEAPAVEYWAHEFAHAVDAAPRWSENVNDLIVSHGGNKLSDSDGWQKAWKTEVVDDRGEGIAPLSKYAQKNEREGFAEYGRLLWTQPKHARTLFPQCYAVWKEAGLV